jgi:hypothetical protein
LLPVETRARIVPLKLKATRQKPEYWAMMALAEILRETGIYPVEAFEESVAAAKAYADDNLAAIRAGEGMVGG